MHRLLPNERTQLKRIHAAHLHLYRWRWQVLVLLAITVLALAPSAVRLLSNREGSSFDVFPGLALPANAAFDAAVGASDHASARVAVGSGRLAASGASMAAQWARSCARADGIRW